MRRRGFVLLGVVVALLLIGLVAAVSFPAVVRLALVWSVGAMTGRQVTVDAARFDPLTGQFSVAGFKLADRDGTPFATFERLDGRLHRRSLLRGHVWINELSIRNSTVSVIRYDDGEFNLSDLVKRGGGGGGTSVDVTVDHFSLEGGTVTLEDRMLKPVRTWRSDAITLEARNVSTVKGGGTAVGSTIMNGAPVSLNVDDLRLLPAHLHAVVEMRGGDLALARVYLPPETPITIDRGRLESRIDVVYDAREGLRVGGDGRIADAVVLRRHQQDPVLTAPEIKFAFRDLAVGNNGTFSLARFEATGGGTAQATAAAATRFAITRLRAVVEGVTWPVQGPARIDIVSTVPGGGEVSIRGTARANPERADIEVRASGVDLAPWARFIPTGARVTGIGDAQFKVTASLGQNLSASARGTAGVNRLIVADGDRRLVAADRAEISGLDLAWPLKVQIGRVRLVRPAATVDRDEHGEFPLIRLLGARPPGGPATAPADPKQSEGARPPALVLSGPIQAGEILVEDGQVAWRDASVKPAARLDVDGIRASVRDAAWPLHGPLRVTLQARTGGGRVDSRGTVTVEPLGAELRVVTNGVDVGSAAPYLGLSVRVGGRTDADLRVVIARAANLPADASGLRVSGRGRVAVNRVTVADATTQLATVERIDVTGLDVDWPSRIAAQRLVVQRPWVLVERDDRGEFPLRALATPKRAPATNAAPAAAPAAPAAAPPAPGGGVKLAMSVGQTVIEDGTVRFVDRTMNPTFTEELRRLAVRVVGIGTAPSPPARYELTGTLDGTSRLSLQGRVGPVDGTLSIEGEGELRDFLVPRVNPYLKHYVSWEARDGRFTTAFRYRVEGDALDVRNEIRIGRLDLIRVAQDDPAQRRIGLPLGMIAGLMKNSRGDIVLTIPIGGRLSDPRFELGEAIWGAIRAVAIKTIAAPVAWIGRLRVGRDSKIEDIEIDPVAFEAGTAKLTAKGADQVERLSGYLRNSAGARMVLTPVVTIGDIDQLRAEALASVIQQRARERSVTDVVAAQQLFAERVSGREPPKRHDEILAALRDTEAPPAAAAQRLATKRVDAVRDSLKQAGIDPARLEPSRDTEGLEAPEGGRIEIALTDRVRPKRNLLAELIHKLLQAFQRPAERTASPRAAAAPSALVADQPPAAVLAPRNVPRVGPPEDRSRRPEKP